MNLEVGETLNGQLTQGFLDDLGGGEKKAVKTLSGLMLTEGLREKDASLLYASQMKLLSSIDNETLDVVLMNQEAFDAFSQNGYLLNLEGFLKAHELSFAEPYLVENVEILWDNADQVLLDPSVPYESQIRTYPCALDATTSPFIQEAGFPEQVFLGILANTPREEEAAAYLSYLWGE